MKEIKQKIIEQIKIKLSGDLTCQDLVYLAEACATLEKDEWLNKIVTESAGYPFMGFGASSNSEVT